MLGLAAWTPVVTLALALLTLVALVTVIGSLVVWLLAPVSSLARRTRERLAAEAGTGSLRLAWLVALVATAGSLFFSEVAHFEPCRLCWYQRIALYPLVVVLGVGAWRHDRGVVRYAFPLAVVGGAISLYHYLIETFPALESGACDPRNPCTLVWFREFGFVTLPFMALSAFGLIGAILAFARRGERGTPVTSASSATATPEADEASVVPGSRPQEVARS